MNTYKNARHILTSTLTFVFVLVLTLTVAFAASSGNDEGGAVTRGYQVGPENVLQIDVYYGRDRSLSRKVRVSSKGYMTFPLLGEVEVNGLTVAELEKKLTELLEKDYLVNPQVSVFIEEYSTVSILGQIEEPGSYEIKGKLTVIELISMAGGFTKIADTNNVRVMRTNPDGLKETVRVKAWDIINRGKEEDDIRLHPGDIVTVAESFF